MKKIILTLCVCLSVVACKNTNKSENKNEVVAQNNTEQVVDMHNAENSLSYCGIYQGVIPAADAPGIQVTLILNDDNSYELHETFIDNENGEFQEKGSYSLNENVLTLFRNENEKSYYKVEEGRLKMLTQDQEEVTSELAPHYILNQTEVFE